MNAAPPPDGFVGCHCTGATRAQVLAAIADGCTTVEAVRRRTGACSGCGSCRPELTALVASQLRTRTPTPGPLTP